ncbi:MAG: 3-hydroxyacyl-CoA dehydrogenase NAD-binding domain-containing protein, partial [Halobacteriota archaeon]
MDVDDINTISVLGAGSMGHGIAEVAALADFDVTLRDVNEEFVQRGYEQIEWSLGKLAEKQQITDESAADALERIDPVVDLETAVEEADIVVEAVPEKMAIKREVYDELVQYAPDQAVFATNTSSLSITDLSETTDRPERFCGMHFFNPPVRMPLVEVISGAHTADDTLDLVFDLAEAMGKAPVRVNKDSPGFVVNRVLVPLMNEAAWLVDSGEATIAEVDSTTKFDIGLPMGLFELTDQVGIDVGLDVLDYMHDVLGDAYRPCPFLSEKVEADELGKKTGRGFYDYENGGVEIPSDAGRDDVRRQLLAIMANEVAALVADDVATVDDIDRAMQLGAGFPDGPASMVDEAGLGVLVETLDERRDETGEARYEIDPHLRELAEAGETFHESGAIESDETTAYETIRVEHEGRVAHVVLDREHRLNTISREMLDELNAAIDRLGVRVETV